MTRMMSDVYEFDGVVDYGTTDYTVNDEFDSPELDLEGNVEYLDKNNTERVMSTQVAIKLLEGLHADSEDSNIEDSQIELDDVFRRRKKKRKRKRKPKKPKCPQSCPRRDKACEIKKTQCELAIKLKGWSPSRHGARGLYERGILSGRLDHASPTGCEDGYHGECANGIRIAWIVGDPRKNWRRKELAFYQKNKKYAKAEACLLFSGLAVPRSPAHIQKAMSNLKGGAPSYCGKNPTEECKARERQFIACTGVRVCAGDCWSREASKVKCTECLRSYCEDSPYSRISTKHYNICFMGKVCAGRFKADNWKDNDLMLQRKGVNQCWGQPLEEHLQIDMHPLTGLSTFQICDRARNFVRAMSYNKWKIYQEKCEELMCKENASEYDNKVCSEIKCLKTCANNGNAGEDCMRCTFGQQTIDTKCKELPEKYKKSAILHHKMSGFCHRSLEITECRKACVAYGEVLNDHTLERDDEFYTNRQTCKTPICQLKVKQSCKNCKSMAYDYNEFAFTTGLGTSQFHFNMEGYGCYKDCNLEYFLESAKLNRNTLSPVEAEVCRNVDFCEAVLMLGGYNDLAPDVQQWCLRHTKGEFEYCDA